MLYLHPPYYIINGVSVFGDHEDPLQFYYLPLGPKLVEVDDLAIGRKVPQIQLVRYRGTAGTGGFLNFDVDLGIEEDTLGEVRSKVKREKRLSQEPRLAPVPLVDGTVKLMLLGKQSGDSGGPFVVKIDHHAKPALYGNNQAAFSVALDAAGVANLEKALQGEMTPIGVIYSLEYQALRPAYSVRLHIDWDRVQKHLDESFGAESIAFSSQINTVVDELIENQSIVFEADTFVPEGEDEKAIITRRDQALEEVRDMITDTFFKPSIEPEKKEEDGWDKATRLAQSTSRLAATGGWGGIASFSYKKVDLTRIDRKALDVGFSERTTVRRSIYPQRHLSGLFRVLRDGGFELSRFVVDANLDDPWFQRRKVAVISRANFEEDGLASINVRLGYDSTPQNVLLESSAARSEASWTSVIENGAMRRALAASYGVTFTGADGSERPVTLESPPLAFDGDNLEINPRELYSIVPVSILALTFPWDRYPHVEVRTRYADPDHGIDIKDTFLLDREHAQQTWKLFSRGPRRPFQYQLIYRAADFRDVEMPWVDTKEERIIVRDPFPNKRTLQVFPNLDWNHVDRAFIDLSYEDPANGVREEKSFELSATDAAAKTFTVDLADPDVRRIAYWLTFLFKNGSMSRIPRSLTLERRIIVRGDARGHNIIVLRPAPGSFEERKLLKMQVEISYRDTVAGLSYEGAFTFQSANDRAETFEYDYVDPERSRYEYRTTYVYANGVFRTTELQGSKADELILPLG
jgi:hypothetical protein